MFSEMPLDSRSLVRVTGLHQYHRVAEHHVCDRAKQVVRLFDPGPLRDRLSVMLVRGEGDNSWSRFATRHVCGVCGGV